MLQEKHIWRKWKSYRPWHTHKECSMCGEVKELTENFYVDRVRTCGWASRCKPCWKIYNQYMVYKHNAKTRGLPFKLSRPQFDKLVSGDCAYCGDPPNPVNGVDRKDSSKGYTVENAVSCCEDCNRLKMAMPSEKFKRKIHQISRYLKAQEAVERHSGKGGGEQGRLWD